MSITFVSLNLDISICSQLQPNLSQMLVLFSEPTPEFEASQTMLAKALAKSQPLSLVGKRLVSEEEWDMLQKEVTTRSACFCNCIFISCFIQYYVNLQILVKNKFNLVKCNTLKSKILIKVCRRFM